MEQMKSLWAPENKQWNSDLFKLRLQNKFKLSPDVAPLSAGHSDADQTLRLQPEQRDGEFIMEVSLWDGDISGRAPPSPPSRQHLSF